MKVGKLYMTYSKWLWVLRGMLALFAILLCVYSLNPDRFFGRLSLVVGWFAAFVAVVIEFTEMRCPKCGKRILRDFFEKVNYCPHCGEKIQ